MSMKVQLLEHTVHPEQAIGRAAAQCYTSKDDPEANIKRVKQLLKQNHVTTLRFATATFHIEGISRACSHQLVRVAHAGILQKSQRYVVEQDFLYVEPPTISKRWFTSLIQRIVVGTSEMAYRFMIWAGVPREDARYCLTEATETALVITANFQTWRYWLDLRTSRHAQWEIRAVALEIEKALHGISPNIFCNRNDSD